MWGAFPLYCGKCCFTLWRCHLCEWTEFFLWPFCLWAKRRPWTASIGPSFCVPFCLWALVPLLLAGLNVWVKLLRELNTALLNFFWWGKKDLVAFDVVIHHREDSGFQLVSFPSLAKRIPSLPSGSSVCVFLLVSLLNFWCYNRFGVDPVFVFHTFIPCLPGFCRLSVLPCSILQNFLKKCSRRLGPACYPRWASNCFLRGGCGRVSLLHRHMAIGWYAFGVSWLNFRVVGMV